MKNRLKIILLGSVMLLSGCKVLEKAEGLSFLKSKLGVRQQNVENELYPKFTATQEDLIIRPDGYYSGVDIDGDNLVDVIYRRVPVTDENGEPIIDEMGMRTVLEGVIYKDAEGNFSEYQQIAVAN